MNARAKYFVCFAAVLVCFIALNHKEHLSGWSYVLTFGIIFFAFACGGYAQQQRIDTLNEILNSYRKYLDNARGYSAIVSPSSNGRTPPFESGNKGSTPLGELGYDEKV